MRGGLRALQIIGAKYPAILMNGRILVTIQASFPAELYTLLCIFFLLSKLYSYSVEGLLSTGPTTSSYLEVVCLLENIPSILISQPSSSELRLSSFFVHSLKSYHPPWILDRNEIILTIF